MEEAAVKCVNLWVKVNGGLEFGEVADTNSTKGTISVPYVNETVLRKCREAWGERDIVF